MKSVCRVVLAMGLSLGAVGMISDARAQSQAEMNEEAGADLAAADKALNAAYKKVVAAHRDDDGFLENLRGAQRSWLEYVDLHLKTVFPVADGEDPRVEYGSMYPLEFAAAKTELLQARTEQLQALLDE